MNDELSDDIKKKFMLPLTVELQDHKGKVFHDALSPLNFLFLESERYLQDQSSNQCLMFLDAMCLQIIPTKDYTALRRI